MRLRRLALALPVLLLATGAAARDFDGEEPSRLALVERIESCLAEKRPLLTEGQACIGLHARPCLRRADNQTTVGMERCHLDELRAWEVLLARHYRDRPGGERGDALREVQRAWLTWRDSACAYLRVHYHGGSMACWLGAQCMAELTARRAIELRFFGQDR
jgi:uncharacterized protein YecT (DUF1311 family)